MNSPFDPTTNCSDCGSSRVQILKRKGKHLEDCASTAPVNIAWGLARMDGETYVYDPPKRKRHGHNKGITKKEKPKLANRLPREKGGLIAALGDGLTPFERALMILGPRVKETRFCYLLDGKPCNSTELMRIAGIA